MRRPLSGFTLIELLITVAILVIVLAIAVPSFRELILNNRRAAQINAMVASLSLARAEAVKRGSDTIVCMTNGASPPDCAAGTAWEQGWIIFADDNGNNAYDDTTEDLIQVHGPLAEGTTLRGDRNLVGFNSEGSTGNAQTFRLCDSRGHQDARGVIVSPSGRARQAVDSNNNGIREDGSGNDFTAADCP